MNGIMSAGLIAAWDRQARRRWTPINDPPGQNPWTSYAQDVIEDKPWAGKCADLACTVLELLSMHGQPLPVLFRLEVVARGTEAPAANHMVAFTWDMNGQGWVVGDTFGEPYPAELFAHTPVRYQDLTDLTVWREGLPWTVDAGA